MAEEPTTSNEWKVKSQTFDSAAELYDRYRPGYPAGLIDDIILLTGLRPESKILEIGSGTGQATRLFAQRGYVMVGLEPGQNLLEVAKRNLAPYPRVRFEQARFEDWEAPEPFDLVVSATAYHWVPENVRYEKTARALKPGGHLAAFWNMYPYWEAEIREELDQVYREIVPEFGQSEKDSEHVIESRAKSLRESPYFEDMSIRRYLWTERYDTKAYLGLLNTYSDHLLLPEQRRKTLFEKVADVIDRRGGYIDRPYLSVLYLARKAV